MTEPTKTDLTTSEPIDVNSYLNSEDLRQIAWLMEAHHMEDSSSLSSIANSLSSIANSLSSIASDVDRIEQKS